MLCFRPLDLSLEVQSYYSVKIELARCQKITLKHLLFKAKKGREQIIVVGRIRTCGERPQWIFNLSPLPLGHDNLIKTNRRKKTRTKLCQGDVDTPGHFKLEHCFSLALTENKSYCLKPQKRHTFL